MMNLLLIIITICIIIWTIYLIILGNMIIKYTNVNNKMIDQLAPILDFKKKEEL